MAFDLSNLASMMGIPLLVLLVILGVFLFMKIMKWAILIAVIALIYFAWQSGLIPGVSP